MVGTILLLLGINLLVFGAAVHSALAVIAGNLTLVAYLLFVIEVQAKVFQLVLQKIGK